MSSAQKMDAAGSSGTLMLPTKLHGVNKEGYNMKSRYNELMHLWMNTEYLVDAMNVLCNQKNLCLLS
jgi:hypothetical protein